VTKQSKIESLITDQALGGQATDMVMIGMKYGPGKNGQQFKPTGEHFGHDHVDTEFTVI